MKVLVLCQMEKRHIAGKLGGGIQAVERLHAELLTELGHEVLFLTTADSDEDIFPAYPEIRIIKLAAASEESFEQAGEVNKIEKGRLNKKKTAEIRSTIKQLEPGAIVNHSFSSSHVKLCAELSKTIPCLCVIHNTPETAGDMSMFAKLQGYRELMMNGSTLVCVSKHQRTLWRKLVHRRLKSGSSHFAFLKSPEEVDLIFNDVCYSTDVNEKSPEIAQPDDYFMVIGRPEKDKNIGKLLEGMTMMANPPKVKIYIAFGGNLEDYDYYNTQIAPHLEKLKAANVVSLHCNASRNSLLDDLARAKGLFVTCTVESSGIAPLEAGALGVPSVVFCKAFRDGSIMHACFDTLGRDNVVEIMISRKEFGNDLTKAIAHPMFTDMNAREKLQKEVLFRHSRAARRTELSTILDTVVEKYKDRTPISLNALLSFE